MPSDRSTLSTAEVDAILTATATSRLMNGRNQVNFLGNVTTPTLNMLRAQGKANATPIRGAYKCYLSGQRGQKLQSVSGRDIHTFRSVDTLFDLEFSVGRVHLGDEWVHQQLEEAGVGIDYSQVYKTIDVSAKGWWSKGADAFEVLVDLADQKLQSLEQNYVQELNKLLWRSNISDAKLWPGMDSLLSWSSNTSGPVGNKSRSNPLLRHQLGAISNTADIELKLDDLRFYANKRVNDGTKLNYNVCGRTFYNAVKERFFSGSSTVSTARVVRNYDQARAEAQANSQKLGVGFPDDAIFIAGVGNLMVEPVFEDLDKEDAPAIPWEKRYCGLNLGHISFKASKGKDGSKKVHATPYNQLVTRISAYGEYALMADWLDCHAVGYVS